MIDFSTISPIALLAITVGAVIILVATVTKSRPVNGLSAAIKFAGGSCMAVAFYSAGMQPAGALLIGVLVGLLSGDRVALALGTIAVLDALHLPLLMSVSIGILVGVAYQPQKSDEEEPEELSSMIYAGRADNPPSPENKPQVYTIKSDDTAPSP